MGVSIVARPSAGIDYANCFLGAYQFPRVETLLSPSKRFVDSISRKFGINISGIHQTYVMPGYQSCAQIDRLMCMDRISSNVGVTITDRCWLGRLDGVRKIVTFGSELVSGESWQSVKNELSALVSELVLLNQDKLGDLDVGDLTSQQLYSLLWGSASSIHERDLKNFCIAPAPCSMTSASRRERLLLKRELEARSGEYIGWHPTLETLERIKHAFDSSSVPLNPGIWAPLRLRIAKLLSYV